MTSKKAPTVAVSIIVTLHKEGILAYKTLRNIGVMLSNAKKKLITCEVLIGLDNADDLTKMMADDFMRRLVGAECTVYESNFGDLGHNRNSLIEKSRGKYVVIHDGDDFFTQNFIVDAYAAAQRGSARSIYIPQFLVNFDAHHYMVPYIPSSSSTISKRFFFETNYYTSQYFIPRSLLMEVRYQPSGGGYGYEDWWLNSELIARGAEFVTVENTAFFYRRKKTGSLLVQLNAEATLIRRTDLFEPKVFMSLKPARNMLPEELTKSLSWSSILRRVPGISLLVLAKKYFISLGQLHRAILVVLGERYLKLHTRAQGEWVAGNDPTSQIIEKNKVEVPHRIKAIGGNQKLIKEWAKLNAVEPLIRASWDMFEFIPISTYPTDSGISNAYFDFCKKFAAQTIDDIIFVPHMVRGGAELATINLAKALARNGKKVLVVTSLNSDSVWASRINEIEGATLIENKDLLIHVPDEKMRLLFWARVVQYWGIKRVTTINSEFGYKLIRSYKRQLQDMQCLTFVHTYAYDVTEDGYLYNFIPNGLVELYGSVNRYITDSSYYRQQLIDINGFRKWDVETLYLPVTSNSLKPKSSFKRKNKVIYAARICNQKISDVAVEVAKKLSKYGIELHFYGSIDPEFAAGDKFLRMIEGIPTVKYMGAFESFSSLPLDDYDVFLLTTRTEGTPIAIIEACLSNIYIVSAAVGGLPECVSNHHNGYLVPDTIEKFDPQAYTDAILSAYNTGACFDEPKISTANKKVATDHSQSVYEQRVKELMSL